MVTLSNGFTVTAGPAAISSLNPTSGPQGANNLSVVIVGANTNFVNGTTTVSFGQNITAGPVTVTDATYATVSINISSTATPGPVTVTATTGGENASIVNGFTVNAATPVISLVNPNTGA